MIMSNLYNAMTVTVPEGELDGLRVERFEVAANDPAHLREAFHGEPARYLYEAIVALHLDERHGR